MVCQVKLTQNVSLKDQLLTPVCLKEAVKSWQFVKQSVKTVCWAVMAALTEGTWVLSKALAVFVYVGSIGTKVELFKTYLQMFAVFLVCFQCSNELWHVKRD